MENKIEIYASLITRHIEREKVGFEKFSLIMDDLSSLTLVLETHREQAHGIKDYMGSPEWIRRSGVIDSLKLKIIKNLADL